jgi:hypothetical protein
MPHYVTETTYNGTGLARVHGLSVASWPDNFRYVNLIGTIRYVPVHTTEFQCVYRKLQVEPTVPVGTLDGFASTCLCVIKGRRNLES